MILVLCWHNKYYTSLIHVGESVDISVTNVGYSEILTIYHVQVVILYGNPFNEHSRVIFKYHRDFSWPSRTFKHHETATGTWL